MFGYSLPGSNWNGVFVLRVFAGYHIALLSVLIMKLQSM